MGLDIPLYHGFSQRLRLRWQNGYEVSDENSRLYLPFRADEDRI